MSDFRIGGLVLGQIQTNCYMVWNDDSREALIVDPADRADAIVTKLRQEGLNPVAILLTHGHADHTMAVPRLKELLNIPVYAGEKEKELLADGQANLTGSWMSEPITFEADVWVKDGDILDLCDFRIKVFETPGHTEGGVCYYFEDDKILLCGDTLFRGSYGRDDLPGGNGKKLAESIKRLLTELPEDVQCCPGHGPTTTVEYEFRHNPMSCRLGLKK